MLRVQQLCRTTNVGGVKGEWLIKPLSPDVHREALMSTKMIKETVEGSRAVKKETKLMTLTSQEVSASVFSSSAVSWFSQTP